MELFESVRHHFQRNVNKALEKTMGLRLHRIRNHGHEDWYDIRKSACRIETIFDVGANVGQTARRFRSSFPKAAIYCFEPVREMFEELQKSLAGHSKVQVFQVAMGNTSGTGKIYLGDHPTTNSLIEPENARGFEEVRIETIDSFCQARGIERIDLLKVDTEGFDLEVLKGAASMLSLGRVAFVLAEVGFHPGDTAHVLFDHVRDFLMSHGFHVYGFYDQNLEWTGENRLRFANACFANEAAFRK
jgi:FkbM family methyltransferase